MRSVPRTNSRPRRMATSRPLCRGQLIHSLLQIAFLKEYGYITRDTNAQIGSDGYSDALKHFQVCRLLPVEEGLPV